MERFMRFRQRSTACIASLSPSRSNRAVLPETSANMTINLRWVELMGCRQPEVGI